jgi:hypothetical protein
MPTASWIVVHAHRFLCVGEERSRTEKSRQEENDSGRSSNCDVNKLELERLFWSGNFVMWRSCRELVYLLSELAYF